MEEKKNKCPLCSKKLVMKGGVPTCPDCGYRDPYRSGSSQPQADYSQTPRMDYGQSPQPGSGQQVNYGQPSQPNVVRQQSGYGQPSQPNVVRQQSGYGQPSQPNVGRQQSGYGQPSQPNVVRQQSGYGQPSQPNVGRQQSGYGQPSQPNGSGQRPNYSQPQMGPYAAVVPSSGRDDTKKKMNPTTIALIIVATLVGVIMVASTVAGLIYTTLHTDNGDGTEWGSYWESSAGGSSMAEYQEPSSVTHYSNDISHLSFYQPESALLKEFVSQLFDKPASSTTREELSSVTGLKIRDIDNAVGTEIAYELSDGTTGICYLSSTSVDTVDFKCFPNIQTLDLGRESLDWGTDWHNLTSLTSLTCQVSLDDLAKYMDVSQLTSLSFRPDFFVSDFSELEAYSNLEYLRVDCNNYVRSFAGLSQVATLQTLIIEDAGSITDYRELYDMKQLKALSIESVGLRDIGFVSDMAALESLELIEADMSRIDAIADCADTLKCLRLHLNKSVEDYSPVLECTGLEELELYVSYGYYDYVEDGYVPDLSMMSELKVLTLGNFETLPDLENLTTLESLTTIGGLFYDEEDSLAGLAKLTDLKSFALLDASVKPNALEVLADMASLETLDLTGTFVWGDLNTVFRMPALKTLILDDVDFGLMLEEMPVSESLLELDMTDANVHYLLEDGSFDMGAGNTRIKLGDHTAFFDHMPNLTTLTVPGHDLQDVEFAQNMTQLTYLDINYNNVADLSPLTGLEQLKVLRCKNNSVRDVTGLENVIILN